MWRRHSRETLSCLPRGGLDSIIGDGALRYAPEYVWESDYHARLFRGFLAPVDRQQVVNPAYNQDRGPLWIPSIRLHVELDKDLFLRHAGK